MHSVRYGMPSLLAGLLYEDCDLPVILYCKDCAYFFFLFSVQLRSDLGGGTYYC